LTAEQRQKLNKRYDEKLIGIKAIQNMFWTRRIESFNFGRVLFEKFRPEAMFISGLSLYWAEGSKQKATEIANSDPKIIKFMSNWLQKFYGVGPANQVIGLHMHSGQNEQNMKQYWSELLSIPTDNFHKSFIKPEGSGYRKNVHYMGTVKLRVRGKGSTYLLFTILGSIASLVESELQVTVNLEDWIEKLPYAR
jgi:hypothetical protein